MGSGVTSKLLAATAHCTDEVATKSNGVFKNTGKSTACFTQGSHYLRACTACLIQEAFKGEFHHFRPRRDGKVFDTPNRFYEDVFNFLKGAHWIDGIAYSQGV